MFFGVFLPIPAIVVVVDCSRPVLTYNEIVKDNSIVVPSERGGTGKMLTDLKYEIG